MFFLANKFHIIGCWACREYCGLSLQNTLKQLYQKNNLFSMGMLTDCLKHKLVIPYQVDWQAFMDWDKHLAESTKICSWY